jgi:hypothetical protein
MPHPVRGPVLVLALVLGVTSPLGAQPTSSPRPATLRLALVSQWTLQQHSSPRDHASLVRALEGGVVDRPVFSWQRGVIQRDTLVGKPIRVVSGPEAEALGGRGTFELQGVRAPVGTSAWTTVEVARVSAGPEEVLVLEVGGELNSVRQVLETLAVVAPEGLQVLPLARRALVAARGVPVLPVPYGRPVILPAGVTPSGAAGLDFVVARSPIEVRVNGAVTTNGPADLSPVRTGDGDWREGDRVLIRVPGAVLAAGPAPLLLGWKDRTFQEGGPDLETPRGRAATPFPLVR